MSVNVYLIRTKLQAFIVDELVSRNYRESKHVFVFMFQGSKSEDSSQVYKVYDDLRKKSVFSLDLVSGDGFLRAVFKLFLLHVLVFLFRGKFLLAGIDGYPFALASKLFPLSSVETFDDGSANLLSWSKYYSENPISGSGIKCFFLRVMFPKGGARYLRERSEKHYTIFSGKENILPPEKVVQLNWDWGGLFIQSDLKFIDKEICSVVLGTPVNDHCAPEDVRNKALRALNVCDLYIMHPREEDWIEDQRVVKLISPAESVLLKISSRKELIVYHFNSTVALSLSGFKNIKFIDLLGCSDD